MLNFLALRKNLFSFSFPREAGFHGGIAKGDSLDFWIFMDLFLRPY